MATKRVIAVNEASLVDLKAELYRKETQFKKEKADSSATKKTPIWQKKKKEAKKGNKKDTKKSPDESTHDIELEKSRLVLETKSALYEKLSKGEIEVPSDEDNQDGRFLVDFHQKVIKENKHENDVDNSNETEDIPVNPDEEWVDYKDSFGRSRRCLRKDFPLMKTKGGVSTGEDEKGKPTENSIPTLLSDDMRREMIRKKWEKEMEESLDKPIGPVHYEDVLFQETRDHGVGYYKFSKAEEERLEQQSLLKNLRTQTEQQREKREKLLAKRKVAMDARLQKVKERKLRKLKKQGLLTDDQEHAMTEETPEVKSEGIKQDETPSSKDENEIAVDDMVERIRNKTTRMVNANTWEKNKIDLSLFDKPKPKAPSYNPHDERNPEFAPPSFYANTENKTSKKKRKWDDGMNKQKNTERVETWELQNNLEPEMISSYNSCPQETSSSLTNCPQGPVDPNLPPPMVESTHHNFPPTYHSYPPPPSLGGTIPPNLPPPPTYTFPPPPLVGNLPAYIPPPPSVESIPPNLPPPPTHTFPPPSLLGDIPVHIPPTPSIGSIPPNLPPPPTHAFPPPPTLLGNIPTNLLPPHTLPPPPFYPPPYPPRQFSTTPCNNYSNTTIQSEPLPPGVE